MKLAWSVVAFLTLKLSGLVVNLYRFPVLRADPSGPLKGSGGGLSVLVPVRDEAARLPATLPGLLDQPADEIIFCDDGSTDDTAGLIRRHAGHDPRVRVFTGAARPSGWTGKTWACDQLAAAATHDDLLFCDADVHLAPGAVAAAVAEKRRQGAGVLSVFPRERTGSLGERLIVPLIDDVVLCLLPFPLLCAPAPMAATAHGAFLLLDRPTYDAIGGFAAVRTNVVEDVALARLTRRRGRRLGLALGGELVSTRMYVGYRATVTGVARGLGPVAGGRVPLVLGWAWHVLAYTGPVFGALRRNRGDPRTRRRRRLWRLALALAGLERTLVEAKTGRRAWAEALSMPLSPLAAAPAVLRALRREHEWKGRRYRW